MEREQIIKALERGIRVSIELNYDCPRITYSKLQDALSLIKELTVENERLRQYEITYETPSGKQTMPNLLSLDGDAAELYKRIEDKVKADTVRKMQDKVRKKIKKTDWLNGRAVYLEIDQIAKEMVEDVK